MASRHSLLIASGLILGALTAACGDSDVTDGGGGQGGGSGGNGSYPEVTPAPGGVRRLTGSQMKYSLEYLLGSDAAVTFDVWGDPQLHGFESIAAAELALGANDVSTLETAVFAAIDTSLQDPSNVARFAPCVVNAPGAACYEEVATKLGRVAWRRAVTADEQARLVAIGNQGQTFGAGDFDVGLRYELSAIFQSPNFVYISEIGEPDGDSFKLTAPELASRMSFFLLHRTPDVELLDAADAGGLADDDGIREQAQRMLLLPEARRAMDRFFSELYLIRDITTVDKDDALFPDWGDALAGSMRDEMLRFLQDIVWTRNADAREIATSQSTFVDATLAAFYGVTPPTNGGWQRVDLPSEQGRFGLIGKAGYLARFAHSSTTSPTKRGRFYRERLLCLDIPPPPPGVNQTLPEPTEPKTMRERLEAHAQNPSCAGCHSLMDPIGLGLEHFDPEGRYRDQENGLDIITAGTSGDLKFDDAEDLANYVAENGAQCLVKNFWRQSMGHLETDGEDGALRRLEDTFADQGYSVQDLIVELCASEGFKLVGDPK